MRHLLQPFAELGTRLRAKLRDDPFLSAKLRLSVVYFIVGLLVSFVVSDVADIFFLKPALDRVGELGASGVSVDEHFAQVQTIYWMFRFAKVVLVGILAYLLAGVALRPVKEANEAKQRLIANLSHELRTPLTIKKTRTEVALKKKDSLTKEEAIRLLEKNLEETERLASLVAFMLSLSSFTQTQRPPKKEPVSLMRVAEVVVARFEERAHKQNVTLRVRGSARDVQGISVGLEQLLSNLVENALKYSPPGSAVEIAITPTTRGVELSVDDSGPGISEQDAPFIFEPFFRGVFSPTRGYGLGLSIVREIAKMHSAEVRISRSHQGGARICVEFPETN